MDLVLQRSLLRRLLDLKRAGTTAMADEVRHQPAAAYTDPDRRRPSTTGLASGSHPGLVFGRNEPALIHYHRGIDAALGTGERATVGSARAESHAGR